MLRAWESSFQNSDQRSGINIVVDLVVGDVCILINVRMQKFWVFTGIYTALELSNIICKMKSH